MNNAFMSNTVVRGVGTLDTRLSSDLSNLFNNSANLETVELLILKSDGSQKFVDSFKDCKSLSGIEISGVIGQNGVNFSYSTELTNASLLSILTALSKDSALATGKTITLSTEHQSKINASTACTEQYNAALSAGWTIAFA